MKKIISVILCICMLSLFLASCATFSEADKQTAETCAIEAAEEYYEEYFQGKTISGLYYSSCSVSTKNTEFNNGKYIVLVKISARVSNSTYTVSIHLMDVEYTVKVNNNKAPIVDTEYITES